MAGKKISQLPQATSFSKDSLLPIVSGSVTYKTTIEDLNVLQKTKTEIDELISMNSLIQGQLYKITGVDVDLYGGTDILITAATTNKLELSGHGIFYNPKYLNSQLTPGNGYGIWSNYISLTFSNIVGTFTNGDIVTANNGATATYLAQGFLSWISGNWSTATSINNGAGATANVTGGVSPSYAIGQDVIWGGKHWTNTSGNVGTAADKYTLSSADWTAVTFNSTDYNVEVDIIHYDYLHDMIIRRKDKWNDDVDGNFQIFSEFADPNGYNYGNPIKDFQWGNGPEDWNIDDNNYIGIQSNYVKDSYLECINFIGEYLWLSILTNNSIIQNNTLDNYSFIYNNTLTGYSFMQNNIIVNSSIEYNIFENSYINDNTLTNSGNINLNIGEMGIVYNIINGGNISANKGDGSISNNIILGGSAIRENTLNLSYIDQNILRQIGQSSQFIEYNILSNFSNISGNQLLASTINRNQLNSSYIYQNILYNGSDMGYNTLTNNSKFDFSSSGTLSHKDISNIEANYADATFNISAATIIYSNYSKQMFRNSDGITRLGYYNSSDVFTVIDVNA